MRLKLGKKKAALVVATAVASIGIIAAVASAATVLPAGTTTGPHDSRGACADCHTFAAPVVTPPVVTPPSTDTTPVVTPPSTDTTPVVTPPSTDTTPVVTPPSTDTTPVVTPPSTDTTPVVTPPAKDGSDCIRHPHAKFSTHKAHDTKMDRDDDKAEHKAEHKKAHKAHRTNASAEHRQDAQHRNVKSLHIED